MSECKHCGMESEHCHYCCDGSHVDLLEEEVALLTTKLKGLEDIDEIAAEYRDLAKSLIQDMGEEGWEEEQLQGFRDRIKELEG